MLRSYGWRGGMVALAAGLAVSTAGAQTVRRGERVIEQRVTVGTHVVLRARPGGNPSPGPLTDCAQTSTYTDVNFGNLGGQSLIAQAGFANNEMAAATYVLTAADFPLKINTAEMVFAGNTSVPTTVHWSVLFWSGTPDQGPPQYMYSSDGELLPHLEAPPGSVAATIQFSIDPNDPEQIILQDNGTHTFTVAFRVDQLNQPSASPCLQGAPTCCNIFPATDNSGLSNAANNWLGAINCGALGCPPNGGWARFSSLSTLCRPSGDWALRANWQPISCAPGIGACCLPNGGCEVTSVANCAAQNGVYQGDNTTCGTVNCPQPMGACCFSNGNCLNLTEANCSTAGGVWQGAGSQCNGSSCPTGACCLPSGACQDGLTLQQCTAQGGVYRGAGTTCGATNCPQPTGACCVGSGCLVLTQAECNLIPGAWGGAGTQCGPTACLGCYPNCDGSTNQPVLNVNDFICFQTAFASGDSYANCDQSTQVPILNVNDFICFQQEFVAGCR